MLPYLFFRIANKSMFIKLEYLEPIRWVSTELAKHWFVMLHYQDSETELMNPLDQKYLCKHWPNACLALIFWSRLGVQSEAFSGSKHYF